jgi:serine/threonine protein kinase
MNRLSPASDVYSFGIVMSEMLTWQIPFAELSKEQVGAGSSHCEV